MSITKCLKTAAKVLGAFVFASAFVACVPELPSALDPLGITSKGSSGGGGGSSTQPETTAPEVEVEGEIERVTPSAEATTATITAPTALANNATNVNPDADIVVAASTKPTTVTIYEGSTLVDTIKAADETYYSGADSGSIVALNVKDQLIIQPEQGDVIIVKPHSKSGGTLLLEYGKTYTVKFDGTKKVSFTTKTSAPTPSGTIKVGSSATADFGSVQGALNYLSDKTGDWTIELEEGSYHERLFYKGSVNLTIKGPTDSGATAYGDKAVIYWKNNNQWGYKENGTTKSGTSRTRVNFLWQGGNLTLKNVTLKSTYLRKDLIDVKTAYGDDGSDARNEVLYFDSKSYLVANDSSFIGTQDTLILGNNGGRAWFYKDYIEGDVDFIWGTLDVGLFEECVVNITDADTTNGYIFASRTVETNEVNKGFVLFNSIIKVPSSSFKSYYGRNSGADTQAAVINCTLTNMIEKELWKTAATKNTFEENGDAGVAYKDYGNVLSDGTAVDVSGRLDQTYTMSKRAALREYNGRYAILNRGFDVEKLAYKFGTVWDISAYETEFNATADESNKNVYVEPVFKQNVVGGTTVQLAGDSKASGVTYTYESSDTSVATVDANGLVTAASGVTDWAVITMTGSNGKKDYFQIGVIPEVIPATKVSVSVADASVAKYGLTTATVSFTPANATVQKVKLTSGNTNVKFYDEATKTLVSELTTENSAVRVWVGGDVSNATITAASTKDTSATKGTAQVSTKAGEATWCAEAGSYRVTTDIQSGNYGVWDGLVINSATEEGIITATGKMSLKSYDSGMQTRNVVLYVPVEGASTITLNSTTTLGTVGIGSSATSAFTETGDATSGYVATYAYDGSKTGIVLGSEITGLGTATKEVGSIGANTKYLKVNIIGSTDRKITSIDVKKTGAFTATWDTQEELEEIIYTFGGSNSSNPPTIESSTGDTSGITLSGITWHDATHIATFAANGYIQLDVTGKCVVSFQRCQYGSDTATLTGTYGADGTGNSLFTTSAKADASNEGENLQFYYDGTSATKIRITASGTAYTHTTLKVTYVSETPTNEITGVTVALKKDNLATISKDGTTNLEATVTPKYLNTFDTTYEWKSSDETVATVDSNGTVTGKAAGTANIYAVSTQGSVESNKVEISVTAASVNAFSKKYLQATNGSAVEALTTSGSGGTLQYASSNTDVADVDASTGTITVKAAGYTKITASIGDASQYYYLGVAPKAEEAFNWTPNDFCVYLNYGAYGNSAGFQNANTSLGTAGQFNGIYVDANGGKFLAHNSGGEYIAVNSDTLIYVPVSSNTSKIIFYGNAVDPKMAKVTKTENAEKETVINLTANNGTYTYEYTYAAEDIISSITIGGTTISGSFVKFKVTSNGYFGKNTSGITRTIN